LNCKNSKSILAILHYFDLIYVKACIFRKKFNKKFVKPRVANSKILAMIRRKSLEKLQNPFCFQKEIARICWQQLALSHFATSSNRSR
jgi:hypothetical protein